MLSFGGLLRFDGGPIERDSLGKLAFKLGSDRFAPASVWLRGPLAVVCRQRPIRTEDRHVAFPVLGRDGALAVVGSARIDNQTELMSRLSLDPQRGWHDCELIAAAFERWGSQAADRLRGDFAFAAVDLQTMTLTLARDCFGEVPLFYHRGDGFVAFASTPAALLALPGVPRTLADNGMADLLVGNATDAYSTVYNAIRRTPRAAQTIHSAKGESTAVYWRPGQAPPLRLRRDDDYVEAAREVLRDVLVGHLRCERPIAVMLSGGLDSSAIASTLAKLAPSRAIHGYTTVPDGPGFPSEAPYVRQLCKLYPNLRVVDLANKPITPLDHSWREAFDAIGLPCVGMPLATRRLTLARAAAEDGAGVIMTGGGGNFTLTREGMDVPAYLARSFRWRALYRELKALTRSRGLGMRALFRRYVLRELAPPALLRAYGHRHHWRDRAIPAESYIHARFADEIRLGERWLSAGLNPVNRQSMSERAIELGHLEYLQPPWQEAYTLLNQRLGMETAMPLRDRRMVDFVFSIPPEQFLRNGVTRWLARRALADRLPGEIVSRTTHDRAFPDLFPWLAAWWPAAAQAAETLEHSPTAKRFIDIDRLRQTLAAPLPASHEAAGDNELAYALYLPDALHLGDFVRWHEGGNR